jgi:DNA helicase TIP49 (TBP-interacting protein)
MVMTTDGMVGLTPTFPNKKEKVMNKYLILSDTVADKKNVKAGDIVELDIDEGKALVNYGKAEISTAKETKKESNRSVGLETSEAPRPKKRTKK